MAHQQGLANFGLHAAAVKENDDKTEERFRSLWRFQASARFGAKPTSSGSRRCRREHHSEWNTDLDRFLAARHERLKIGNVPERPHLVEGARFHHDRSVEELCQSYPIHLRAPR